MAAVSVDLPLLKTAAAAAGAVVGLAAVWGARGIYRWACDRVRWEFPAGAAMVLGGLLATGQWHLGCRPQLTGYTPSPGDPPGAADRINARNASVLAEWEADKARAALPIEVACPLAIFFAVAGGAVIAAGANRTD